MSLMNWLVASQGVTPYDIKAERTYLDSNRGYGFIATADVPADEVLLSVPLEAAITSQGASEEEEWSWAMADRFLQKALQTPCPIQPWIDNLPKRVSLPWLYWSDEEIEVLQYFEVIEEARNLQVIAERALQKYPQYNKEMLLWALSLVHSRSFIFDNIHVWVPGVDLCNHTLSENAAVRVQHSPEASQGVAALEEIAPPPTEKQSAPKSYFQLLAGEEGISAGEEVTISYGSWPNDVLLMFFGFVPEENPYDSVVLFNTLYDLAAFLDEDESFISQLEALLGAPMSEFERIVVTAEGFDGRLFPVLEAAVEVAQRGSVPEVLVSRMQQLLEAYPTTIDEDGQLLLLKKSDLSDNMQTAVRFRLNKKRILSNALSHFT